MDPELARYLNRNYWQQKHEEIKPSTTQPSAPIASVPTEPKAEEIHSSCVKIEEVRKFCSRLKFSGLFF
jgi:growth factor-regulated tyrosine kinase substrate